MSRQRLGRFASVTEQFRLSGEMAEAFATECEALGKTRSAVMQKLIERWLRKRQALKRLKGESHDTQKS